MLEDVIEIVPNKNTAIESPPTLTIAIAADNVDNLTYNEFFEQFMLRNVPILITGIGSNWECMNWIANLASNAINFEYLAEKIDSKSKVPIANCSKIYFNSHEKSEIDFGEFLTYWKKKSHQSDEENDSTELLYLKDWHLRREKPNYKFYRTPNYFASDWLNEYCETTNGDDYRFVYMGPKRTWTPFHADVFSSFSWSTNIVGVKRWILFPPKEEEKLKDRLGNLPFDIGGEHIKELIDEKNIQHFEIIQKSGQTLFVPSNWHHQVWNLEDTISINHNWFNGCNINQIWLSLFEQYNEVLHEIEDCRDMDNFDEHCQLMLKSVFGMDFNIFLDILSVIVDNRVKILGGDIDILLNESKFGENHARFDLEAIQQVLLKIQQSCSPERSQLILEKIYKVIQKK